MITNDDEDNDESINAERPGSSSERKGSAKRAIFSDRSKDGLMKSWARRVFLPIKVTQAWKRKVGIDSDESAKPEEGAVTETSEEPDRVSETVLTPFSLKKC